MRPHFLIIGAARSGTTSLYSYLVEHPRVVAAAKKELHFFDLRFPNGPAWYRDQFPSLSPDTITGEASPYYLFHSHVPKRVFKLLPHVKLIVLLRNPVDRAYSHYYHAVKHGIETLPFERAIEQEDERLRGEVARMLEEEN